MSECGVDLYAVRNLSPEPGKKKGINIDSQGF